MSRPSRRTGPASGGCSPVMTLNSVVLPAPFGPISPVTAPGSARSRSTFASAMLPPKRTVTPRTSSSAAIARRRVARSAEFGVEPADVVVGERPVDADPLERLLVRSPIKRLRSAIADAATMTTADRERERPVVEDLELRPRSRGRTIASSMTARIAVARRNGDEPLGHVAVRRRSGSGRARCP